VTDDGKWFAITFPAWSIILALGVAVNSSWLINPFLAAMSILLAHSLIRKVVNRSTANIVILFMAVSPWLLTISATMMNHTSTLTLTIACWLALYSAKDNRSIILAFVAGLCAGWLFITRPLDGLIIGTLTGLWGLFFLNYRTGKALILSYVFGCIAIGGLVFPFNAIITGDPLLTPLNDYINHLWYPGANRLGFGLDIGPPDQWGSLDIYKGHSFTEALIYFQHNMTLLNFELFGWGGGSLLLVFIHIIWGRWNKFEFYMLAIIIITFIIYSLYWFSGSFYVGPRYWFITFFPLIILTVGGFQTLTRLCSSKSKIESSQVGVAFITFSIIVMISFLPWRGATKYYEFRGFHTDYKQMLVNDKLKKSLIFIRETHDGDFGSALIFNEPDFSGDGPIFAYDRGFKVNSELAKFFPEHDIYYVQGRSEKNNKARIIKGPLSEVDIQ